MQIVQVKFRHFLPVSGIFAFELRVARLEVMAAFLTFGCQIKLVMGIGGELVGNAFSHGNAAPLYTLDFFGIVGH